MTAADAQNSRVLVVEDDADLAHALSHVLESDGFRVQVAQHGDHALTICEQWLPDVIVLDHNLPVMTGEQFLQEIRWRPVLSRVPVLLVSALEDLDTIARRLRLRHYLRKPFPSGILLETLRRIVAGRQTMRHRTGD